jgi:hypothetical protein
MREIPLSGSEGGERDHSVLPTPIAQDYRFGRPMRPYSTATTRTSEFGIKPASSPFFAP